MGYGLGFFKPSNNAGGGNASNTLSANALLSGYEKSLLVTKAGNDTGANGTANKPFLTIQAALNYAVTTYSNFDEPVAIIVGPGSYTENLTITRHNTYIVSQLAKVEQRAVTIIGSVTINCSSANSKYNQIVGLEGLFISANTAVPTVKITGTAEHTTYLKDCYVASANSNSNANCLLADSTLTFAKSKINLQNNTFLSQNAGPDVIKVSGGDVVMDSNRIFTSNISGNGNGIVQSGNSIILADRLQVDITTNGKCISANSTYTTTPDSPTFLLSNSSLVVRGSSSAEVAATERGMLLWNVLVSGKTTSNVKGTAGYVLYNNLVSLLPSVAPVLDFPTAGQKIKLSAI